MSIRTDVFKKAQGDEDIDDVFDIDVIIVKVAYRYHQKRKHQTGDQRIDDS